MEQQDLVDSGIEDNDCESDSGTVKVSSKRTRQVSKKKKRSEETDVGVVHTIEPDSQKVFGVCDFEFVDPTEMMKRKKKKKNGEEKPVLIWEVWEEEHKQWIDNSNPLEQSMEHSQQFLSMPFHCCHSLAIHHLHNYLLDQILRSHRKTPISNKKEPKRDRLQIVVPKEGHPSIGSM